MEELQDAIEDAQYVNAISKDEGPSPMIAWAKPEEKQLEAWKRKKTKENEDCVDKAFSPEWFLAQPVGFFLFAQFVKDTYTDFMKLNFLEDIIRYRKTRPEHRFGKAQRIVRSYLLQKKEGVCHINREINEHDIAQTRISMSKGELAIAMKENIDEPYSLQSIGLKGPLLKQAIAMSADILINNSKNSRVEPDCDIYDSLRDIIFESLKNRYWVEFLKSNEHERCIHFLWFQDREVVEDDFNVLRVLGRGGFGLVVGCRKGTSGKLYAMKVVNKKRIKIKKSEQLTLNECMVLAAVNSPFVVNLKYSFQSKDDVFLILDLMTGGDLSFHLERRGFFEKKECIYYATRIMLGLQALHDKQFVYRDLKPENCLLADDGRMKLTDLGLACKITPGLHGAAGTRGYWAPEMLRRDEEGKRKSYGHTVDWFSFGCLLAELISGTNPYRSEAALDFGLKKGKKTKEKAIDCAILEMEPALVSSNFDEDSLDLCNKLLEKDETIRIGVNGCEEIMSHAYFKNLNWENIMSDRMMPPYIPPKDVNALSQKDIGQFSEDKEFQETALDADDESHYKNWNWTNPVAYSLEVIEFLIYERESGSPLLPIVTSESCCLIS